MRSIGICGLPGSNWHVGQLSLYNDEAKHERAEKMECVDDYIMRRYGRFAINHAFVSKNLIRV